MESTTRWSPPNPGFIKINVDASWKVNWGLGFAGVVARDKGGNFLGACRYGVKAGSVDMVEALAIKHDCEMGHMMGWNSVIIKSDSSEAISCLQDSPSKGRWEAFPVLMKCIILGKSFHNCCWSWIPRLANKAADLLASRRCKEMCNVVWVDRPPSSLVHVLYNESLPCPP